MRRPPYERNPDLDSDAFTRTVEIGDRVAGIGKQLKNPTIPVYDPTNFPDDATRGQIVRDINDLSALWIFGEDDQWHQVAGAKDQFIRYITLTNTSTPLVSHSVGGVQSINFAVVSAGGTAGWASNDTEFGTQETGSGTSDFTGFSVFRFDHLVPTSIICNPDPPGGIFIFQGYIDLRVNGGVVAPYDFYQYLGVDSNGGLALQAPQRINHELVSGGTAIGVLTIDAQEVIFHPNAASLEYDHTYSSGLHLWASFSAFYIGPTII